MGSVPFVNGDSSRLPEKPGWWDNSPMPRTIAPPSEDALPVAREVYRRMAEAGLSQKSLAKLAGVNETYVRDLFRGKSKNPKGDQLLKLAAVLGCSVGDLIDPGRAGRGEQVGQIVNEPSEAALLRLWGRLSPTGKELLLWHIRQMIFDSAPNGRKIDNG
jgi:transcriptional regulator with XRE-family HTH domain